MKKQRSSIDGFIPRQSKRSLGSTVDSTANYRPFESISKNNQPNRIGNPTGRSVGRSDIDESLWDIDNGKDQPSLKDIDKKRRRRFWGFRGGIKKPQTKSRRIIKWFSILLIIFLVGAGIFAAFKFITAGNNIFQGSILDIFQTQPLKQDSSGRSNILILGTSEDDPGHGGADLTDSMLVVSVDQKNKNMFMFSVPRDLYVKYGEACISGYEGKVNAYFSCADTDTTTAAEQNRLTKTQKLVGDVFGLDIQYGVHVNQSVIREAVDAVGGIDVDVQGSNGASGVLDRNFDWRCNYKCYLVKYDNGVHHLDGTHALFLAQARGDVAPTYGLGNSNFDREKNQQKIIMALKNKAMTTGTLTNLGAVTKLIDSFGSNLRTNIQTNEIRTFMNVLSEVKSKDMKTLSLFGTDTTTSVVTSGSYGGASVVMPSAGIFDYSDIQTFVKKNLSSDPVIREAAPIAVLNGTGQSGLAQAKADELTEDGYNVTVVDTAPEGSYDRVEIYQIGSGNTATAAKLTSRYGVKIKKTTPPVTVDGDVRFVIIIGSTTD